MEKKAKTLCAAFCHVCRLRNRGLKRRSYYARNSVYLSLAAHTFSHSGASPNAVLGIDGTLQPIGPNLRFVHGGQALWDLGPGVSGSLSAPYTHRTRQIIYLVVMVISSFRSVVVGV